MRFDKKIPVVALVGMPNSGKSTLINRLANKKVAVVANEEHTTRDLNWGEEIWEDLYIRFVDTGGLVPDPEEQIQKLVKLKTLSAISQADLLVWVIDRKTNVDSISLSLMQNMWKSGKPFIIGINKVDNPNDEKDISEYAHIGGNGFVNFSSANGYNLNELMDMIVEELIKIGFEKGNFDNVPIDLIYQEKTKTKDKRKIVKKNKDGTYYVIRNEDEKTRAPGTFQSVTAQEIEGFVRENVVEIDTVVFDLTNVIYELDGEAFVLDLIEKHKINEDNIEELIKILDEYILNNQFYEQEDFDNFNSNFEELTGGIKFDNEKLLSFYKFDQEMINSLNRLKKKGLRILYCTNTSENIFNSYKQTTPFKLFEGGISSHEYETQKPDLNFYYELINQYNLEPEKTVLFDNNNENIEACLRAGLWGVAYINQITDIVNEVDKIQTGKTDRVKRIPKILFMGKPNVGKSSLFNAMALEEIQIVSDIAGTTLSVNDTLVERTVKEEPRSSNTIATDGLN